jgi:hypothetical protein
MKKRVFLFLFSLLGLAFPQAARGQFIGYTTPQSVQHTLALNTPCTGAAQNFITGVTPGFSNLGQTQHYVTVAVSGDTNLSAEIDGIDKNGNVFRISDVLEAASSAAATPQAIFGTGYFPQIQVSVTCSPGTATFTLSYSGTSAAFNSSIGSYLLGQVDKTVFANIPANAPQAAQFQTPFANSAGLILFTYTGVGPAGSTLQVQCSGTIGISSKTFTLLASASVQAMPMPPGICPAVQLNYVSGGATAFNFSLEYVFFSQGTQAPAAFQYTNITTSTSTQIKTVGGYLHTIVINTPGTGETLTLFDNVACSGTKIGTITVAAGDLFRLYDLAFQNGLCIVSAGATPGDYTVTWN